MVFRIDEREKRIREKTREAINLAMEGRWHEAATVNGELLALGPDDVEASNRQGRAHLELGERDEARSAFGRSLKLAPDNAIARKNLDRIDQFAGNANAVGTPGGGRLAPAMFISDSGLSTTVILSGTAESSDCAHLSAGVAVELSSNGDHMSVHDASGLCLGAVPPNVASRLHRLMQAGNRYAGAVVSASAEAVTVLLHETYRHPSQSNIISFPPVSSAATSAPAAPEVTAPAKDDEAEDPDPAINTGPGNAETREPETVDAEVLLDAVEIEAEGDGAFSAFDSEDATLASPDSLEAVAEAELEDDDEEMEEA